MSDERDSIRALCGPSINQLQPEVTSRERPAQGDDRRLIGRAMPGMEAMWVRLPPSPQAILPNNRRDR